jgi:hypothetical protein
MLDDYFTSKTLKAMICTSAFVFDKDTTELVSSVTNEVTGSGYTSGGIALTGVDVIIDTTANEVRLIAEDLEFGVITVSNASQIVVYTQGAGTVSSRVVSVHQFATTNISQEFIYIWPTDGSGNSVVGVYPY